MLNVLFGLLAVASLFFSLFKLWSIIEAYKKYELVIIKVLELKKNKNSKNFIKNKLLEDGLEESLIDDVVEELFEIVA